MVCRKNDHPKVVIDIGKFIDLTGQKFGRLTVLHISENYYVHKESGNRLRRWICKCECGNIIETTTSLLLSGESKSCGCLRKEMLKKSLTKHGDYKTRLYDIYRNMKNRCLSNTCTNYNNYGGRGISVCAEWIDSYINFKNWALQNGYSENLTLDRIDVNGDYCPENCRWVDDIAQMNNTRHNKYLTYDGKTQSLSNWAREYGMNRKTLTARLNRGMNIEEALNTPVIERRKSNGTSAKSE